MNVRVGMGAPGGSFVYSRIFVISHLYLMSTELLILRRVEKIKPTVRIVATTNKCNGTGSESGWTCMLNGAAIHETGMKMKLNSVSFPTLFASSIARLLSKSATSARKAAYDFSLCSIRLSIWSIVRWMNPFACSRDWNCDTNSKKFLVEVRMAGSSA